MKKLFFVFALLGMFSYAASAQKCCDKKAGKACASKTAAASTSDADMKVMASLLSKDASIEKRTDAAGVESFVKKEVDAKSGKVTYCPVEYCSKEGKFVCSAPDGSAEAKACASKSSCKKGQKGCCSKKMAKVDAEEGASKMD